MTNLETELRELLNKYKIEAQEISIVFLENKSILAISFDEIEEQ